MNFKFNSNLQYQNDAINSVLDLLNEIRIKETAFSFSIRKPTNYSLDEGFFTRKLTIDKHQLLSNLQTIQKRNGLRISDKLVGDKQDKTFNTFDIEMETGTGKTYVFLRTIFELNKKYGFNNFIIVVPSVAIKEGILKSLEMTKEHFARLYDNTRPNFFLYDSQKINKIWNFVTSNTFQIMIITIQSFNKDVNAKTKNVMYLESEQLNGNKPIDLISQKEPIVIIDEPQTTDNTEKSNEAINKLNPTLKIRYSATFRKNQKTNEIYKLDAVDAYNKNLVKTIEVYGSEVENLDNSGNPYIKLVKTDIKNRKAVVEVKHFNDKKYTKTKTTISIGSDLYELTQNKIYENYILDEIRKSEINFINNETISLSNPKKELDNDFFRRDQIRQTIETHLDRQLNLLKINVKVLSLFFIDRVKNYREYDDNNYPLLGKYAKWFEEAFIELASKDKYSVLFKNKDINTLAKSIHNGYFSQDKNKKLKDSTSGVSKDDESTYKLIMKDKEKLLSFNEDLAFIFTHSALKEGWDNPNIFQICTLNESSKSIIKKRQEVGRGLRLCVDQDGNRITDNKVNILSIIANESYEDFAQKLQKEIEEEQGIKFKVITKEFLASIKYNDKEIGVEKAEEIFQELKRNGSINENGYISNTCKEFMVEKTLSMNDFLNDEPYEYRKAIVEALKNHKQIISIINGNEKTILKINKDFETNPEFEKFWKLINKNLQYSINFNSQEMIADICNNINADLETNPISNPLLKIDKTQLAIDREQGVHAKRTVNSSIKWITNYKHINFPDIVSNIETITGLTRKTIIKVILDSNAINNILKNPTEVEVRIINCIKKIKSNLIKDGIKYFPNNDAYLQTNISKESFFDFYENVQFKMNDLIIDLQSEKYSDKLHKYPFSHILCDSNVENKFATETLVNDHFNKFFKLPKKFKIKTPIGSYNPDWALIDEQKRLYMIVETKGSDEMQDLRESEKYKIEYASKFFAALNEAAKLEKISIRYEKTESYNNFLDKKIKKDELQYEDVSCTLKGKNGY